MLKSRLVTLMVLSGVALALIGAASWTQTGTTSVRATFTTGEEGTAPPASNTDGLNLAAGGGIKGFVVALEAPIGTDVGTSNIIPVGAKLRAWLFNPHGKAPDGGVGMGGWARAPELDLIASGGNTSESWAGFRVTAPVGRIAYLPELVGGPCTVYINGVVGN